MTMTTAMPIITMTPPHRQQQPPLRMRTLSLSLGCIVVQYGLVLSCMLRDSIGHYNCRSVGPSISQSVHPSEISLHMFSFKIYPLTCLIRRIIFRNNFLDNVDWVLLSLTYKTAASKSDQAEKSFNVALLRSGEGALQRRNGIRVK